MGTGLLELSHALIYQAPSTSGLQRNAIKVGSMIVQMVQDDLRCTENFLLYFKHLLKPTLIVSTTGYIVTAIGPYLADGKNSDAKNLNHIMGTDTRDIKTRLHYDDIMIVDRGFRDSP